MKCWGSKDLNKAWDYSLSVPSITPGERTSPCRKAGHCPPSNTPQIVEKHRRWRAFPSGGDHFCLPAARARPALGPW